MTTPHEDLDLMTDKFMKFFSHFIWAALILTVIFTFAFWTYFHFELAKINEHAKNARLSGARSDYFYHTKAEVLPFLLVKNCELTTCDTRHDTRRANDVVSNKHTFLRRVVRHGGYIPFRGYPRVATSQK